MMKKNLFLNKKFLIKWTENETAFLVQSPFNANAGIWWSKKWYQQSKYYNDYFATGIILNQEYKEITYDEKGIKTINIISGQKLFEKFNYMKNMNQIKYLKMAQETQKQLNTLASEQKIFNPQFCNDNATLSQLAWN